MNREEAITYFEGQKKRLEDFRTIYPSPNTVGYQATTKEISFYDMAISALSAEGEKKCSKCIHSAEQDGEFCYECIKGNEDNFVSAEGEYIKKEDMERILYSTNNAVRIGELFTELPTYSFPDSAENKGEITALEAENRTLRIELENAEEVLRGLKEDLADARAELRERR